MITVSEHIFHDVLAHEWENVLLTRPHNEDEVGKGPHEIRIVGRIVRAA